MAIQRPVKTYGTRSYATEVTLAPGNQDPVLANEVDADFDTIYAGYNAGPTGVAGGRLVGSYPNPGLAADVENAVAGNYAANNTGTVRVKDTARPQVLSIYVDGNGGNVIVNHPWGPEEPARAGWLHTSYTDPAVDQYVIFHRAANAATGGIQVFSIDGTGNIKAGGAYLRLPQGGIVANGTVTDLRYNWSDDTGYDAGKVGWLYRLDGTGDAVSAIHRAVGGAQTTPFALTAGGNLTLTGRLRRKAWAGARAQGGTTLTNGVSNFVPYTAWFNSGAAASGDTNILFAPSDFSAWVVLTVFGHLSSNGGFGTAFEIQWSNDAWATLGGTVARCTTTTTNITFSAIWPAAANQAYRVLYSNASGANQTYDGYFALAANGEL